MSVARGSVTRDRSDTESEGPDVTEQDDVTPGGAPTTAGDVPASAPTTSTGHPQVDQVLQSVQTLDDLPVDQHVAVFEAAHTGLREALSSAATPAATPAGAPRG